MTSICNKQNKRTIEKSLRVKEPRGLATGAVQSGIASITGSAGDQANADQSKAKADAEKDLSHTAAKAGPFTLSSSGAPAKDSSDRTDGQWNQTVGSLKETTGNLIGNENLKQQGREQNLEGQGQEAKGQISDLGQGISDRVGGTIGGAIAGLSGNTAAQKAYQDQHVSFSLDKVVAAIDNFQDEGKTRQRGVELDLNKQAEAERKSQ